MDHRNNKAPNNSFSEGKNTALSPEEKWIDRDKKRITDMLDLYLIGKDKWKKEWGQKERYKLKNDYKPIEKELYYRLPENETHHRGFVVKKGYNDYGVYLQVFTEESFLKAKKYLEKK